MSNVINFVKKNFECLSYVVIVILLLLGCFFEVPMWILTFVGLLCAIFFSYEKILALYLFITPFEGLFTSTIFEGHLFDLITLGLIGILAIRYFYDVIKKGEKLNFKIIIPMAIFLLFCLLPIHNINIKEMLIIASKLGVFYVVYQKREQISITKLTVFFSLGFILSSFLSFLRPWSPRIIEIIPYFVENNYIKFSGLLRHPNTYALLIAICMCSLLYLKLIKKISALYFYLLFIPMFIFGFMTISRNFVIGMGLALLLFIIFYIVKYKKAAFKFLSLSFVIGVVILACLNLEVRLYLVRFKIAPVEIVQDYIDTSVIDEDIYPPLDEVDEDYEYEYKSDEWWDAVYRGEIKHDPGRKGIWEMYLTDWASSPMTILFGRGAGSKSIGQMNAHNLFIQTLWDYGIIGYILLFGIIFSFIDLKAFKKQTKKLYLLILLILPYYVLSMFESLALQISFYIFLILSCNELLKEKNKLRVLYYNTYLSYGGTNVYMVNLVENIGKDKLDFDVLVKTRQDSAKTLEDKLIKSGAQIHYLSEKDSSTIGLVVNASLFYIKNVNKYDVMHINATRQSFGIISFLASQLGNINKVILHSHMGGNDNKSTFVDKIGLVLIKCFSTNFVACSDKAGEFMFGKKLAESGKVLILNNSIDLNKFSYNLKIREEYRKEYKLLNDFVLLNVGRFAPQKNQLRLIEVFKKVVEKENNAKLLIIGEGDLKDEITKKIEDLNLKDKIILLGARDDVNKFMQASDVFIMTSTHEGLPIVAVEAESSGLPLVLASTISKQTDITGNCVFVPLEENDEVWANKIISLKTFPRKDVSQKIIEKKFDNVSAVKVVENLYLGDNKP